MARFIRDSDDTPFVSQLDQDVSSDYGPGFFNNEQYERGPKDPPPPTNDKDPEDKNPKRPAGGGGGGKAASPYSASALEELFRKNLYDQMSNPLGLWQDEAGKQQWIGRIQTTVGQQYKGAQMALGERYTARGMGGSGAEMQSWRDVNFAQAGAAATGISNAYLENQKMKIQNLYQSQQQYLGYAGILAQKYAADKAASASIAGARMSYETGMYNAVTNRMELYAQYPELKDKEK